MTRPVTIARDAGRFARTLIRGVGGHADRERNRRWQDRQVASVVSYAARHVPYYRRLFREHHVDPSTIRTAEDLRRVPITTKATLKRLPLADRVSDEYVPDGLIRHSTSGSSGIPFQIRRTWFDERRMNVFWVRQMIRQGVSPGDRIVMLVGDRGAQSGDRLVIQQALARFGVFRTDKLNSLRPVEQLLEEVERLRPDQLMGYGWAMLRLADAYLASGRRGLRLKAVHPFGEVVTPEMRVKLTAAYQCPVHDVYGSYEFGMAAFECQHHDCYHVSDDAVVLEVLRDGVPVGAGEAGTLTGTNLLGYAMPFIRFDIGDIATRGPDPCPCGWHGATIAQLRGRMLDMFPLPGGRVIHPYQIVFLLIDHLGDRVFQYQLVQETTAHVVLYLVPTDGGTASGLAAFQAAVERVLGDGVDFEIRLADAIDFERSGKFRVSRSNVASAYDHATPRG